MSGIIVRNGNPDKPRMGIDWRAVAALGGFMLALGTLTIGLLNERVAVLAHVAKGESLIKPVEEHMNNVGPYKHLTEKEHESYQTIRYQLMDLRRSQRRIERHLGIQEEELRLGVDHVPPGQDD